MTAPIPGSRDTEASPARRHRIGLISEPGKAGVKTHVVGLLQNVDVTRFEIVYYYSQQRSDASYPQELAALRARGITCVEVPMDTHKSVIQNVRAFLKLVALCRAQRPALLHLHSSIAGGVGRLASLFIFPRPVVLYTPHAMAAYRSKAYLWLERILGVLTDVLIAVSPSERADFIRWRIPKARTAAVIPLGVHLPTEDAAPAEKAPRPEGTWVVGACGRICGQKNALLFFRVAVAALAQGRDWHFRWIGDFGDDPEAEAVKALLEKAGRPDRIEVTGWVSQPQPHLEALDVFCMFSRYESFGYVTAEAMLLGVPVLATPATGTVDLIQDGVTGSLVEPQADAIVAALDRLQRDAPRRAALAANARRFVAEHHTVAEMVAKTEALYAQHLSP